MAKVRLAGQPSPSVANPPADRGGMLHSWHTYPAYRLLLSGTMAASAAFWMYQVAIGWLALQLTDSPFFVGLAGFAGGIPFLLFSLPAGVAIDRFDRRAMLLVTQLSVAVVAVALAVLIGLDAISPWSLLVLAAASGTTMSLSFPTRTAIVPSLVERPDLANAIALNSAGQNAMRVVGPSLAGVLIALLGASGAFAIAAVMQVLALVTAWWVPSSAVEKTGYAGRGGSSLTLGLRIVARDPFLLALILLALAPTVLVMPYLNLMPVFARDDLDVGSTGLGLLLASTGLGTVAGALSVARSSRLRAGATAQVAMAAAFAILVMLFAFTPVVPVAGLLLFAAGWASGGFMAINQTAVQLSVDDAVRGRVLSIHLMTWGMLPIGQLALGALASRVGTPWAMAAGCSLALACIGLIVRRYPSLRA